MRTLVALSLLAGLASSGCSSDDPCEGLGTCVGLTVRSSRALAIDQLAIQLSGQVSGDRLVPPKASAASLPQKVALEFNPPGGYKGSFGFQVEVVALKNKVELGAGAVSIEMKTGQHLSATVLLGTSGAPEENDMALTHPRFDMLP